MESSRKIDLAAGQTPPLPQDLSQQQAPSPPPALAPSFVKRMLTVFSFLTILSTIIAALKNKLFAVGALIGQLLGKLNIGSLLSGLAPKLKGGAGGGKVKGGQKNHLRKSTPKRGGRGIGSMAVGGSGYGGKGKRKGLRKLFF